VTENESEPRFKLPKIVYYIVGVSALTGVVAGMLPDELGLVVMAVFVGFLVLVVAWSFFYGLWRGSANYEKRYSKKASK
jgi:hypothetical protein